MQVSDGLFLFARVSREGGQSTNLVRCLRDVHGSAFFLVSPAARINEFDVLTNCEDVRVAFGESAILFVRVARGAPECFYSVEHGCDLLPGILLRRPGGVRQALRTPYGQLRPDQCLDKRGLSSV